MVKITRIQSPTVEVFEAIAQHLTFHSEALRPLFLEDLAVLMLEKPESVLFLLVKEEEELRGFVIAHNPGPRYPHVHVLQAWSDHLNTWDVGESVFMRLILWAWALGKIEIKAETLRDEAMFRRFGFVPAERIVRYIIDDGLVSTVLHTAKEFLSWAMPSNPK